MPCYVQASTTAANCVVWATWVKGATSSAITMLRPLTFARTSNAVWHAWTQGCVQPVYQYQVPLPHRAPMRELTDEEKESRRIEDERRAAAHREEERLLAVAREKWEKERKEATAKAEALLKVHLDERQRRELEKDRKFHVVAKDGARYEIAYARSGNVSELDADGRRVRRYCIHPVESVPDADTMLAQKLLLECDPDQFKRVANVTQLVG